ncbi:MAG TPA: hypothetical protein VFM70_08370 [Salinimicrobium sp.]|nr:hypothetical protein [Salinimicrobium sp.]
MNIHKILKYLAIVVGVIGLIFLARVLIAGDQAITDSADVQASVVNPFLYIAYFVFVFVVALVLVFVIKGLFTKNVKNTLISTGILLLLVAIAYFLADGNAMYDRNNNSQIISESGSKWVGTGLITFYFLGALAIGTMIFSGVKKLIK